MPSNIGPISKLFDTINTRIYKSGLPIILSIDLFTAHNGKSETAIELVKRGHRLIADDAVEIKKLAENRLIGSAPELIRHYVELRGIGVIDVRRLFGVGAVKLVQDIHLIIDLEPWQDGVMYDRLGLDELYTEILGVRVPSITVPVKPGRTSCLLA